MIYLILFLISLSLTYYIKNHAIKNSLLDIPNERSSHSIATPHGGGIAIALTWFLGITYLYIFNEIESSLYFALMVGVVISAISYLDDLYGLSAKVRLFVQFFVAFLGLYFLNFFDNNIFIIILAIFMIVWFINLYNFLDGIDGYAGSEAVFLGLAGFILFDSSYFLVLVVSVLGFLIFNWHKAKIFMGDVGSTLLGYTIAIFALSNDGENLSIWLILFSLFIYDATITLYRRFKRGKNITYAHKSHAYQRLTQSSFSHAKVVILAMLVNFVFFGLVYFVPNLVIVSIITLGILFLVMRYVDKRKAF